ncbi:MAG: hypothetical protein HZB25_08365 [Candidatus Eisenbacteria bacterium]|nr:hypothetical protein [Candidatus Eisenbacteria bacterium]
MWWRTFFLQAAWSYAHKQNLGFASLYRRLAPGTRVGPVRLLEPFNTNPVTSCFVLPYLRRLDPPGRAPDGAPVAGVVAPPGPDPAMEEFLRARGFLATSFAATGDRLVWYLLRPAAGLLGAGLAWWTQSAAAGAAVLVAAYGLPQLALRATLWRAGAGGASPAGCLRVLTARAERVRRLGLALTGFLAVAAAARGPGWDPEGVGCLLVSFAVSLVVLRWKPRAGTLLALGLLAAAVFLNRGMPRVF